MWLKNTGFIKCPNHLKGKWVRVRFGFGGEALHRAKSLWWGFTRGVPQIVEYKIVEAEYVD